MNKHTTYKGGGDVAQHLHTYLGWLEKGAVAPACNGAAVQGCLGTAGSVGMLILLPRAAVVALLLLLVLPLLLLLVMPATVAVAAGFDEEEKDRLPVLLVLRRTALAPVDVAKAANCLVGRSTEVSMARADLPGLPVAK